MSLIENPKVRVIDASTAFRVAEGWAYGFPELEVDGYDAIASSARFANPDFVLQPGLFGRLEIEGSNTYTAVLIPDEAIAADQNERVVYVLGPDNTVASKPVRPGPRLYGYRVIREGLTGDEQIVVQGVVRVRPGAKVTPVSIELPPQKDGVPETAQEANTTTGAAQ